MSTNNGSIKGFFMDFQFANKVLKLANEERSERGLNPLKLDNQLTNIAEDHSQSMAKNDFFGHKDPTDNSSSLDRINEGGYEWSRWGENVAAGYSTPEDVMEGWMKSPGHRKNILNPNFTEMGIGYEFLANDKGSVNYNHYWTQVFGTPLSNSNNNSSVKGVSSEKTTSADITSINTSAKPPSFVQQLTGLINRERTEAGLDSLEVDKQLSQAARQHSKDMAINDYASYKGLDGSTPGERIEEAGYGSTTWGENIVLGSNDAEAIVDYLMKTGSRSNNILNPDFDDIGIGYKYLGNDTGSINYKHYVTIDFAAEA